MSKEPTLRDIESGTSAEIKKAYGIDGRQLEQAIRKNLSGASRAEIQKTYENFYNRK
jgi:hypothetical protein